MPVIFGSHTYINGRFTTLNVDDRIHGTDQADWIWGLDGDDTIKGGFGADLIYGGSGNDSIQPGSDNFGPPIAYGRDTVYGHDGDDYIDYRSTTDDVTLYGNEDNDTILGGHGHDTIDGGTGNDTLMGAAGNDTIKGGTGADKIYGGTGFDKMWANDNLWEDGRDQFWFSRGHSAAPETLGFSYSGNIDTIVNFHAKEDVLDAAIAGTAQNYVERYFSSGPTVVRYETMLEWARAQIDGGKTYAFADAATGMDYLFADLDGDRKVDSAIAFMDTATGAVDGRVSIANFGYEDII